MIAALASVLLLAFTRAELIDRMNAPVVTQMEGLVSVYASCPEDMRREYQMPVASFVSDTVRTLYRGESLQPRRFASAGIVVHLGSVRTNDVTLTTRARTNDAQVVTHLFVRSPGYVDLYRFKLEVIKAFYRCVKGTELDDDAAITAYRRADPRFRIEDTRIRLERWLAGCPERDGRSVQDDDEECLALMRKVLEPGKASVRDVLTFASRLFLYPPVHGQRFCGVHDCLSFREAVACVEKDQRLRIVARVKADNLLVYGGGRGESLSDAAKLYWKFLLEFAQAELPKERLLALLDEADAKLNAALDEARRQEEGK